MTDTMTPSEIAERLHDLADGSSDYWDEFYTQAAATIRELEAGRAKWEAGDGLDGSVVHAVREVLNRANVPTMAFIDDHVAHLVHQRDATEAKLKIATEALSKIEDWASDDSISANKAAISCGSFATDALARIKEVGGMGETKHTSGPWQWSEDGSRLLSSNRFSSRTAMVTHDEFWRPHKADANLIAAAPELLEVAQNFVRWVESPTEDGSGMAREQRWVSQAIAALAKANGEGGQ